MKEVLWLLAMFVIWVFFTNIFRYLKYKHLFDYIEFTQITPKANSAREQSLKKTLKARDKFLQDSLNEVYCSG